MVVAGLARCGHGREGDRIVGLVVDLHLPVRGNGQCESVEFRIAMRAGAREELGLRMGLGCLTGQFDLRLGEWSAPARGAAHGGEHHGQAQPSLTSQRVHAPILPHLTLRA